MKYITKKDLLEMIEPFGNSSYARYLKGVAERTHTKQYWDGASDEHRTELMK